jgi:hypothetical protein
MTKFLSIFIPVFLFVSVFTIININKRDKCQYKIVLKDKKNINARTVNLYKSGFVDIRDCSGKSIIVMEGAIDTIKILN